MTSDRYRLPIAVAVGSFLALLSLMPFHELGGYGVETDFYGRYIPEAEALLRGQPHRFEFSGPGYPLLVGILRSFLGDPFRAGQLLSAISAAVASFFAFLLGRTLGGYTSGLWLQGLLLLGSARYAVLASTECYFLALVTAATYLLLHDRRLCRPQLFALGALSGWATISRYNGIFLLIWGFVVAVLFRDPLDGRRKPHRATFLLFGFVLSSGWWWYLNTKWNGHPFASSTYQVVAAALHGSGAGTIEDLRRASLKYQSLSRVILDDLGVTIAAASRNLVTAVRDIVLYVAQPLPAIAAVVGAFSSVISGRRGILVLGILLGIAPLAFAPPSSRYLLVSLPAIYGLAAVGVTSVMTASITQTRLARPISRVGIALLLLSMISTAAWKTQQTLTSEPIELLSIARAIKDEDADGGNVLVARKPHLAVLTNNEAHWPAATEEAEFFREAGVLQAKYLYVSDNEVGVVPFLAPFITATQIPGGWAVLVKGQDPDWVLYVREQDPR